MQRTANRPLSQEHFNISLADAEQNPREVADWPIQRTQVNYIIEI